MAAKNQAHRAMSLGLTAGVGLTVPLVAYAATLPFDTANDVVRASGLPFAVGVIAGAGVYALAERYYAPAVSDQGPVESVASASEVVEEPASAAFRESSEHDASRTGFFSRHAAPSDVPIISRAVDAMSEEEAWAEIDSLMSEGSPVSCDARTSKDIYQIALEELSRAAAQGAGAAGGTVKSDSHGTGASPSASAAGSTAMFMAAAGHPISNMSSQATLSASASAVVSAVGPSAAAGPASTAVIPSDVFDLDEPSGVFAAPPRADAGAAVQEGDAASAPAVEVHVVDYSGHEEMWAAALAVLAEDDFVPADRAAGDLDQRSRAVAEGERSTRMHSHVNEILGEELERVDSQSMRHTTHEYLRVIQGGTMSMPRVQAEA